MDYDETGLDCDQQHDQEVLRQFAEQLEAEAQAQRAAAAAQRRGRRRAATATSGTRRAASAPARQRPNNRQRTDLGQTRAEPGTATAAGAAAAAAAAASDTYKGCNKQYRANVVKAVNEVMDSRLVRNIVKDLGVSVTIVAVGIGPSAQPCTVHSEYSKTLQHGIVSALPAHLAGQRLITAAAGTGPVAKALDGTHPAQLQADTFLKSVAVAVTSIVKTGMVMHGEPEHGAAAAVGGSAGGEAGAGTQPAAPGVSAAAAAAADSSAGGVADAGTQPAAGGSVGGVARAGAQPTATGVSAAAAAAASGSVGGVARAGTAPGVSAAAAAAAGSSVGGVARAGAAPDVSAAAGGRAGGLAGPSTQPTAHDVSAAAVAGQAAVVRGRGGGRGQRRGTKRAREGHPPLLADQTTGWGSDAAIVQDAVRLGVLNGGGLTTPVNAQLLQYLAAGAGVPLAAGFMGGVGLAAPVPGTGPQLQPAFAAGSNVMPALGLMGDLGLAATAGAQLQPAFATGSNMMPALGLMGGPGFAPAGAQLRCQPGFAAGEAYGAGLLHDDENSLPGYVVSMLNS